MTFVVSGKLTIDASQGKSELTNLQKVKRSLYFATMDLNKVEKTAQAEIRKIGQAAGDAARQAKALQIEEAAVATQAVTMGRSHQLAAGQVGNLTAQFNDIGVMMAAGQNPFQLAIQQGTQITQVIGNMGAAGAAKALKAALVSMVSPLTLITIGSIAAGAALVNWLTGADDEIASFEDQLTAMGEAIETFAAKAGKTRLSTAEMIEEFGSASPELRMVLADMAALAKMDVQDEIDATAKSVRNLVLDLSYWDDRSSTSASQDFLGLGSIGSAAREAGYAFAQNLELLNSNEDAATRLKAALDVRGQLLDAAGGLESLNGTQREFYEGLSAIIRDLELFAGALQAPWNELKATGADLWSSLSANVETYLNKRLQVETQARNQIELLRLEAETQQAIIAFGEGSVEVAELRLQAERLAYEQQLDSKEISELLKAEMMAAWDAANGVATVDMAGNIGLAADEAHRLMVNMMKANGQEIMGRIRENPDFADPRGESRGAGNSDYVYQDHGLPDVDMPSNPKSRRSRKGGGAASYNKERKAIERLMERERQRLEVLQETDPVLKEMIRIRDRLKGATDAERVAVEALIRERVEEEQAIARTEAATDFLRDNSTDLVQGLVRGGDEAAEAWDRVKAAIAAAALEALLLGDGPLGNLFGLGGKDGAVGGLVGILLGGIGLAEGHVGIGTVHGDGGNRDDKVPAWLSPGETVVHAKATRRYRPVLQAMNDGVEIPGLANGGEIGGPSGSATAYGNNQGGGSNRTQVEVLPSPLFDVKVREISGDAVVQGLEHYDREVAPDTVHRIIQDPLGVG